jgi:hypothetical protein
MTTLPVMANAVSVGYVLFLRLSPLRYDPGVPPPSLLELP